MSKKTTPPKLNREWHLAHGMPKNATFEQRVAWHHIKNCACRSIPEKLAIEMKKLRIKF